MTSAICLRRSLPGCHADSPLDQFVKQRSLVRVIVVILCFDAFRCISVLAQGNSGLEEIRYAAMLPDPLNHTFEVSLPLPSLFIDESSLASVSSTLFTFHVRSSLPISLLVYRLSRARVSFIVRRKWSVCTTLLNAITDTRKFEK